MNRISCLFTIFSTALLFGCATNQVVLKGINHPLTVLQSTVEQSLPIGKRKVSQNGREFFSEYFVSDGQNFRMTQQGSFRMYAKVVVLGDRRPYDLEVFVVRERRVATGQGPGSYETVGNDQRLAKVVMARITESLAKRREDRNFIDDFRVF